MFCTRALSTYNYSIYIIIIINKKNLSKVDKIGILIDEYINLHESINLLEKEIRAWGVHAWKKEALATSFEAATHL